MRLVGKINESLGRRYIHRKLHIKVPGMKRFGLNTVWGTSAAQFDVRWEPETETLVVGFRREMHKH